MGYTNLWECKQCGTLPKIEMRGKNFQVKCSVCDSEKTTIYANSLDDVVKRWNQKNEPAKPGLFTRIKDLFRKKEEEEE